MMKKTDIVIVGAGLVGLSAACLAAQRGYSVCVLETHLPEILTQPVNSTRPLTLSYGTHRTLLSLGLRVTLSQSAFPITSVHVSEQGRLGYLRFSAAEMLKPALGYVLPLTELHTALYHHAASQEKISFLPIKTIQAIENNQVVCDALSVTASLIIAADGTQSTCRQLLNIIADEKNTNDIATIYQLRLQKPHDHTAYERFTKKGVLAILPLANQHQAQLVWTKGKQIEVAEIHETIRACFHGRLAIDEIKQIAQFPLKTVIARKQVVGNTVLLGNAAHTIYPLAAQGFNLGLYGAEKLIAAVAAYPQAIPHALEQYLGKVRVHQEKIIRATGQLATWFDLPFLGCARGLGMLALNSLKPFKYRIAREMMGL